MQINQTNNVETLKVDKITFVFTVVALLSSSKNIVIEVNVWNRIKDLS